MICATKGIKEREIGRGSPRSPADYEVWGSVVSSFVAKNGFGTFLA